MNDWNSNYLWFSIRGPHCQSSLLYQIGSSLAILLYVRRDPSWRLHFQVEGWMLTAFCKASISGSVWPLHHLPVTIIVRDVCSNSCSNVGKSLPLSLLLEPRTSFLECFSLVTLSLLTSLFEDFPAISRLDLFSSGPNKNARFTGKTEISVLILLFQSFLIYCCGDWV